MQIFLPLPDPIQSLQTLDKKRLFNQINECRVILRAINGGRAWRAHPVVLMYKNHPQWVEWFAKAASTIYHNQTPETIENLRASQPPAPPFIGYEPLHQSHRRRLFTKAPELYPQFQQDGKSLLNLYIVDQKVLYYRDGKLVATRPFQPNQYFRQTNH